MDITYIKDDIFKTNIRYIIHGCNMKGVMGSGIAKTVKEMYPEAYKLYKEWHTSDYDFNLGNYQCVYVSETRTIINALTQSTYGRDGSRFVSYDALSKIFKKIDGTIEAIAMPKIGAVLGGGDWKVISAIIESELKITKPFVYIWEP